MLSTLSSVVETESFGRSSLLGGGRFGLSVFHLLLFSGPVARVSRVGDLVQGGAAFGAQRPLSLDLGAEVGRLAVLPVLHELGHAVVGQVLVEVLVVHLDHGGVHARAQALHLLHGEEAVFGGLALANVSEVLDRADDFAGL